jgi:hypothetical protein
MRDDAFGLSTFRQLVDPTTSLYTRTTPANPAQATVPSFAAALAKAKAQAAGKPYQSPLKQTRPTLQSPNAHKPTLTRPTTSTTSTTTHASKPSTPLKPAPAKPLAPVQKPEAVKPTTLADTVGPLPLNAYPHPDGDNGRGVHWIPTTKQSKDVVDKFVAEAQRMGVKWVTFLNDGANVGDNDYLVNKLVGAGIEPIMRLYSPTVAPLKGDIEGMVRHYVGMGVHYFQAFNEPNLNWENAGAAPSVDRYLDAWLPAAKAIVRGGGLPGIGALSPGGDKNDVEFLTEAMAALKQRGELGTLDRGWLSMHNYTHNRPIEDSDGFSKFRTYHQIMSNALGRDIPIVGTEGGTFVGEREVANLPAVDANMALNLSNQAFRYMRDEREPWNFAYSFWTIANEAGGGTDQGFSQQALFKADGSASPIVSALRAMA